MILLKFLKIRLLGFSAFLEIRSPFVITCLYPFMLQKNGRVLSESLFILLDCQK